MAKKFDKKLALALSNGEGDAAALAWLDGTGSIQDVDPGMAMNAIQAAVAQQKVALLQGLEKAPKVLRKAARLGLHQLKSQGVNVQAAPSRSFGLKGAEIDPDPTALLGPADQDGYSEFLLGWTDAEGTCILMGRFGGTEGMRDLSHGHASRGELRRMLREMQEEAQEANMDVQGEQEGDASGPAGAEAGTDAGSQAPATFSPITPGELLRPLKEWPILEIRQISQKSTFLATFSSSVPDFWGHFGRTIDRTYGSRGFQSYVCGHGGAQAACYLKKKILQLRQLLQLQKLQQRKLVIPLRMQTCQRGAPQVQQTAPRGVQGKVPHRKRRNRLD